MQKIGVDFAEIIRLGLVQVLGETPAYAALYYIGKRGLNDPNEFVNRIYIVFGYSASVILNRFLADAEKLIVSLRLNHSSMTEAEKAVSSMTDAPVTAKP